MVKISIALLVFALLSRLGNCAFVLPRPEAPVPRPDEPPPVSPPEEIPPPENPNPGPVRPTPAKPTDGEPHETERPDHPDGPYSSSTTTSSLPYPGKTSPLITPSK